MSSQEYKTLEDLLYKSYKAQDTKLTDKQRGHYLHVIVIVEDAKKERRRLELHNKSIAEQASRSPEQVRFDNNAYKFSKS